MSIIGGANIVRDGLIFGYDADLRTTRFYPGEPTTNLYYGSSKTFTESLIFPIVPPVIPVNGGVWNSLSWNGKIDVSTTLNEGDKINFSGYYMPYSTDTGIITSGNGFNIWSNQAPNFYGSPVQSVPWNKWYYFNANVTVPAGGLTEIRIEDSGYDYYHPSTVNNTSAYWCNVQVEVKSHSTPFVNGIRSVTESLIDLTKITPIDVSNMSFDSNGILDFNGSSNIMDIPTNFGVLTGYTISFINNHMNSSGMTIGSLGGTSFYWYGDNSWRYVHGGNGGEHYYSHNTNIPLGTWGYYCVVYNGVDVRIYRQGLYEDGQNTTGTADFSNGFRIGAWAAGGYRFLGKIPVLKIYNRPLSPQEVSQDFNAYRSRFGL